MASASSPSAKRLINLTNAPLIFRDFTITDEDQYMPIFGADGKQTMVKTTKQKAEKGRRIVVPASEPKANGGLWAAPQPASAAHVGYCVVSGEDMQALAALPGYKAAVAANLIRMEAAQEGDKPGYVHAADGFML